MWQAPRGLGCILKMNCSAVHGPHPSLYQSIAYKELFPVVTAGHVWGWQWHQHHVLFHSDNEAVVHFREFKKTMMAMGILLNKRFNRQNSSCACAL